VLGGPLIFKKLLCDMGGNVTKTGTVQLVGLAPYSDSHNRFLAPLSFPLLTHTLSLSLITLTVKDNFAGMSLATYLDQEVKRLKTSTPRSERREFLLIWGWCHVKKGAMSWVKLKSKFK